MQARMYDMQDGRNCFAAAVGGGVRGSEGE